ncbi:symmetrical bis(5'-nucleosyl)-tetraphosphatase [Aliikangiella sp. IMCC44359]|uniref:symmetrical bis(5'-nucleosyl)-tetraphosphatase n=1 Tax=Aliikangiella sp. IMCC44359 TaxID=3459125 RepID=UPI00403AA5A3
MATYAIGDIQGCYQTFQKLLNTISFNPTKDTLWLAGDLINRGPQSLQTLEFIYQHKNSIRCVLGNHDLHFLAVESQKHKANKKDTFDELLNSPLCHLLAQWLIQQPLFHWDQSLNCAMVHAGVPHNWTIQQTLTYSQEVSNYLQSSNHGKFFTQMYGNTPNHWDSKLQGLDRLRYITNALTRMRYCHQDGSLELTCKKPLGQQPSELVPWFEYTRSTPLDCDLVFGHWASLEGNCSTDRYHALDTGCVWGGKLTALRLEDKALFHCNAVE